ncbi:MAG: LysR family transcriptional regulator [Myxococcales bacterium]|nr:LysR family transcriptional regulator [Myxococcales bacterium]MCB9702200.1 LysR family transcriptional regulator [Myxococcales bacterium]
MELNLEWVDAFVDFADHLNFTHAARARHLSQPALHGQIRRLQELVGAPLYHRQGRNLELSEAGRRLAAFGRELRLRERAILADLRGPRADAPVVLQAGEGAYLYLLGPALRRFRHPDKGRLQLRVGDADGTLRAVAEGIADLGVLPLGDPPAGIEAAPIAEVGQMLVLPRAHPLAERSRLRLRDLAGEALIVPPAERPHRRALAAALAERGIPWEVAVEATGWALMIQLCRLGVGLAIVNDFCRLPRELVGLPLPELPRLRYAAIRRRDLPVSSAGARLWSLLTGE